jgi:benzoyl-CoA reductase subunit B
MNSAGSVSLALGQFAIECLEAVEKAGYARDLCAYLRNYWGSAMIGKFLLADGTIVGWPKPDFMFTYHHCCSHAPWYRKANEIEGGDIPLYIYDHPTSYHATPKKKSIDDYLFRLSGMSVRPPTFGDR